MSRSLVASGILLSMLLLATAVAQWQVDPRQDTRVGPIYPEKPYSFHSAPPGYDPFQFNWSTGRWDYVPIPYDQPRSGQAPSPYRFNWHSGRWDYRPWDAAPPPGNMTRPQNPPPSQPDDSELWAAPTTQPQKDPAPKPTSFAGRLESMRAVNLGGTPEPELLLRLRDKDGKTTTVDVGSHLQLSSGKSENGEIAVTGKPGEIDGCPVLFADKITIGDETQEVLRDDR